MVPAARPTLENGFDEGGGGRERPFLNVPRVYARRPFALVLCADFSSFFFLFFSPHSLAKYRIPTRPVCDEHHALSSIGYPKIKLLGEKKNRQREKGKKRRRESERASERDGWTKAPNKKKQR